MGRKSNKKSNDKIDKKKNKEVRNIYEDGINGNIFGAIFSIVMIGIILISPNLSTDNVFESIFYYIATGLKILLGRTSIYLFLILLVSNLYAIRRGRGFSHTSITRKVVITISYLLITLIYSIIDISSLQATNISEAFSELISYAFELRGGGLIGAAISAPFYSILDEKWFLGLAFVLLIFFAVLSAGKFVYLIYKTIKTTINYYNSEAYIKKKNILQAKKDYERSIKQKSRQDEENSFVSYIVNLQESKLDRQISTKIDAKKDETEYYTKEELDENKRLWLAYQKEKIEQDKKMIWANRQATKQQEEASYQEDEFEEMFEEEPIQTVSSDYSYEDFKEEEPSYEEMPVEEEVKIEPEIEEVEETEEIEEPIEQTEEVHIMKEQPENSIEMELQRLKALRTSLDEQDEVKAEEVIEETKDETLKKSMEELFSYKGMDPAKKEEMKKEIDANILTLEETLKRFGIDVKVVDYGTGPTITRYEIKIPYDVKVRKVTELENEIKMHLKAQSIRIEAPIPGKDTIGIETPNKIKEPVYFSNLIHSEDLDEGTLPVVLGKDIVGKEKVIDIAKLPHVLIAGTTGSGKSICINTMIASLISKKSDDEVKFIMIDPKMVELMPYNGIPHLLTPVIIDPNMASVALKWAVNEMEARYKKLSEVYLRNIESYNKKYPKDKMPYIVIIIDELADLMMVASNNVEQSIARIAQKARAVGIHLIVATQRPSVDVVTGMIKANLPSRISFALRSSTDSRTILDQVGADKLLGKGDMLFLDNGHANLERLQGAYISDDEIIDLTDLLKSRKKAVYNENILVEEEEESGRDELFTKAVKIAKEQDDKITISQLQRELKVGFNRASRICDELKREGVIDEENRYIDSGIY